MWFSPSFYFIAPQSLLLLSQCNNCFKLLLHPNQRLNFFSDYSHSVTCPYCQSQDTHFIKKLDYCYTNQPLQQFQQWP
jgi:headcase protein